MSLINRPKKKKTKIYDGENFEFFSFLALRSLLIFSYVSLYSMGIYEWWIINEIKINLKILLLVNRNEIFWFTEKRSRGNHGKDW